MTISQIRAIYKTL